MLEIMLSEIKNVFSGHKIKQNECICYTDGSYRQGQVGYSALLMTTNKAYLLMGSEPSVRFCENPSQYSEAMAVMRAVNKAMQCRIQKLEIRADCQQMLISPEDELYLGTSPLTTAYSNFIYEARQLLDIDFVWVQGHCGNVGNELMNKLAYYAMCYGADFSFCIELPWKGLSKGYVINIDDCISSSKVKKKAKNPIKPSNLTPITVKTVSLSEQVGQDKEKETGFQFVSCDLGDGNWGVTDTSTWATTVYSSQDLLNAHWRGHSCIEGVHDNNIHVFMYDLGTLARKPNVHCGYDDVFSEYFSKGVFDVKGGHDYALHCNIRFRSNLSISAMAKFSICVNNMSSLFMKSGYKILSLSNFDTRNVQNMCNMFSLCTSLKYLDISSFQVNKNCRTAQMFNKCTSLRTLLVSDFRLKAQAIADGIPESAIQFVQRR